MEDDTKLVSRVATLEAGLQALTSDVRELAGLMKEQTTNITGAVAAAQKDADEKTKQLTEEIMKARVPHWGNIMAAAGLLLIIIGGLYYPINKSLDVHTNTLKELQGRTEENAYHRGKIDAEINFLKKEYNEQ